MRVEVLTTLKSGKDVFPKGRIYDDSNGEHIPRQIKLELSLKTGTVRQLEEGGSSGIQAQSEHPSNSPSLHPSSIDEENGKNEIEQPEKKPPLIR